jgi:hypothetical protein
MGCSSGYVYPPVGVAGELDAEFLVDGPLVERVGVGQHRHDVAELGDERFDFVRGESVWGLFAAEFPFQIFFALARPG